MSKRIKESRKYFDDIAKSYMETDREYYDKYIAPFYSSPFGAVSSGAAKKAASAMIFAVAILAVGIGAVVFFIAQDSTQDSKVVQEKSKSAPGDFKENGGHNSPGPNVAPGSFRVW